jgi:hypothetical protein
MCHQLIAFQRVSSLGSRPTATNNDLDWGLSYLSPNCQLQREPTLRVSRYPIAVFLTQVSVRPVLDSWPTFRDLLLEDCEKSSSH